MKTSVVTFAAGLALVAALPFAARSLRASPERCALDGVVLDSRHAVGVVDEGGSRHVFCCISCAQSWRSREPAEPRVVGVVAEDTGATIPASDAWFVRSLVVAFPATDCRIHAFSSEDAARRHASEFHGTLLLGSERPFRPIP